MIMSLGRSEEVGGSVKEVVLVPDVRLLGVMVAWGSLRALVRGTFCRAGVGRIGSRAVVEVVGVVSLGLLFRLRALAKESASEIWR